MQPYTSQFYDDQSKGSSLSALETIPYILELINPQSVLDIGCGIGTWLGAFKEFGVNDICGVDGNYVQESNLRIPRQNFIAYDLTKPFKSDRKFDLAISLEVGEHLADEKAEILIQTLVDHSEIILFSAAIPNQGGTYHINEQWPDYWVKLFKDKGYNAIDCLRKRIWQNNKVEWWYAQNMLVFATPSYIEKNERLRDEAGKTILTQLSIVHPRKHLEVTQLCAELRSDYERLKLFLYDIATFISAGSTLILVDNNKLEEKDIIFDRKIIPFLERNGQYWGAPANDEIATNELVRMRSSGATFIVISWPAFWWIDYYKEWYTYLTTNFTCVLHNERVIIFDLGQQHPTAKIK